MIRDDLKLDVAASYHTPGIASQEVSVVTNEGWTLKISSEYSVDEAKKNHPNSFRKRFERRNKEKSGLFGLEGERKSILQDKIALIYFVDQYRPANFGRWCPFSQPFIIRFPFRNLVVERILEEGR